MTGRITVIADQAAGVPVRVIVKSEGKEQTSRILQSGGSAEYTLSEGVEVLIKEEPTP